MAKRTATSAILAMAALAAMAQAPCDTTIMYGMAAEVSVTMPAALHRALVAREAAKAPAEADHAAAAEGPATGRTSSKVGYRVQVFDDNNVRTAKQQAEECGRMLRARFPELEVYTQFNSPYWRVKAGDFRTRSEADAAMAAIRSAFPAWSHSLRIVRDKISNHRP